MEGDLEPSCNPVSGFGNARPGDLQKKPEGNHVFLRYRKLAWGLITAPGPDEASGFHLCLDRLRV